MKERMVKTSWQRLWARARRDRARLMAVVALSALIAIGIPGEAGASPFYWRTGATGCTGGLNSADSAAHGFWYSTDLSYAMATASNYARSVIDTTDLTTFSVSTLAFDTDVPVYDQDYSTWCAISWHPSTGGAVGLATCVSLATHPANACEKADVRFDQSFTDWTSSSERFQLACHEFGHTLGLGHVTTNDTCMKGIGFSGTAHYSSHEVSVHINPNY
jgi:hypothetical protein